MREVGEDRLQEQRANKRLEVGRHVAGVVLLASVREIPARFAIDRRLSVTGTFLVHGTLRETPKTKSEGARKVEEGKGLDYQTSSLPHPPIPSFQVLPAQQAVSSRGWPLLPLLHLPDLHHLHHRHHHQHQHQQRSHIFAPSFRSSPNLPFSPPGPRCQEQRLPAHDSSISPGRARGAFRGAAR